MTLKIHDMRLHEGQARPLNTLEFQLVIDDVRRKSTAALMHIALLQMSFRAGLRAKEIAELKLSDICDSKGEIKGALPLEKSQPRETKVELPICLTRNYARH